MTTMTLADLVAQAERGLRQAEELAEERKLDRQAQERAAKRRAAAARKVSRDAPDDTAVRAEADDAQDDVAELGRRHAEVQRTDDRRVAEAAELVVLRRFEAAVQAWQERYQRLEPGHVLDMSVPRGRMVPDGRPSWADRRLMALAAGDLDVAAALHLQAAGTSIPRAWASAHGVPHASAPEPGSVPS